MSIRKIDGVTVDADTLDGTDLATLATETEVDDKIAAAAHSHLTPIDYQLNPATGDFVDPEHLNDGLTVEETHFTGDDKYAQVLFGFMVFIRYWRQFGSTGNVTQDSRVKIQYYGVDEGWHDWVTDITPRDTNDWSETVEAVRVLCGGIKVVVTTFQNQCREIKELEVW
ncbi:hypothetical protein ES708_21981 [subsurface metagenome]